MSDDSAALWSVLDQVASRPLTSPWRRNSDGDLEYAPDIDTLVELLAVPLGVPSTTIQSGLHAKAVDVWMAYELRRAGFAEDDVWPRNRAPRVMPREVTNLLAGLPKGDGEALARRLTKNPPSGVVSAEARVLGRAYFKQVDVVMSHWSTGPELMISTKRLGSSLANNALNRVEESYGDAHNLRGRHPLAAIGYVLVVRKQAMDESPRSARRLLDLIGKMGTEPGGYDATAVVIVDWVDVPPSGADHHVRLYENGVPRGLTVAPFLERMIDAVLARSPVELHETARERYAAARDAQPTSERANSAAQAINFADHSRRRMSDALPGADKTRPRASRD